VPSLRVKYAWKASRAVNRQESNRSLGRDRQGQEETDPRPIISLDLQPSLSRITKVVCLFVEGRWAPRLVEGADPKRKIGPVAHPGDLQSFVWDIEGEGLFLFSLQAGHGIVLSVRLRPIDLVIVIIASGPYSPAVRRWSLFV
jgi:hypothetical protein